MTVLLVVFVVKVVVEVETVFEVTVEREVRVVFDVTGILEVGVVLESKGAVRGDATPDRVGTGEVRGEILFELELRERGKVLFVFTGVVLLLNFG